MRLDYKDFNLGIIISSPDGEGVIEAIDRRRNEVKVWVIDLKELKSFKIEELYFRPGQLKLSFCTQTGEFIFLFQRLENRLRDFLEFCLDLNKSQRKLLTSDFTAGSLQGKLNQIFKEFGDEQTKGEWAQINKYLQPLLQLRNTLIHGYLFHYDKDMKLDHNSFYFENPKGAHEILTVEKLDEFTEQIITLYYRIHKLFSEKHAEIKEKIISKEPLNARHIS